MISVLAQERLLGAALGSALAGIIVFTERRNIYQSIADNRSQSHSHNQIKEIIYGKESHPELAHLWNRAVDQTLGPVVEYFSSQRR